MFVLCVIVPEDKVARQVQVKILARPPIVNIPLEQKPVRVPVLLERTALAQGDHADAAWHAPAWPQVTVEVEKCLTAVGEIEVTLVQISAAQEFLEFLARIARIKHHRITSVAAHESGCRPESRFAALPQSFRRRR